MLRLCLLTWICLPMVVVAKDIQVDVCVYGGSSAGVIAAYASKKLGKTVVLIEPGNRLGGLSSGGLGFTDIGNKNIVTGLSRDFYRRVGKEYGKFEQWIFEPKVAKKVFEDYIREAGCQVLYGKRLTRVIKNGTRIEGIIIENSKDGKETGTVKAKQFIDCSYEGDLMAGAGVSYTIGRESNAMYNETVNGVQLKDKHQFPDGIDPYKIRGKPESGLLWGISAAPLAPMGSGDKKVQAYNFRLCLSSDPANKIPITRPEGYDAAKYELLLRFLEARPAKDLNGFLKLDYMPNNKTDINNNGPFSTDMIGMNYEYPDGDYAKRQQIRKQHEIYTKGLLYFIASDPRMPQHLRSEMQRWGLPKDEYVENGNWSPQMYVREARRMVGAYVMTDANCLSKEVVPDEAGKAAYTMDSHNCQRIVVNGMVKNEGDVQMPVPRPYPVSYRSIIPKKGECSNLFVPVCLSASHIAYGSIRMEPVFMVLAQSAAVAASIAIDQQSDVQAVNIKDVQQILRSNPLLNKSVPDILVDNEDSGNVSITGKWATQGYGGHGPSFLVSEGNAPAKVSFTPAVQSKGRYDLYVYFPLIHDQAKETRVTIFDGSKTVTRTIQKDDIKVLGQTSGEWVPAGTYYLQPGKKVRVDISGSETGGRVAADAVLFTPQRK